MRGGFAVDKALIHLCGKTSAVSGIIGAAAAVQEQSSSLPLNSGKPEPIDILLKIVHGRRPVILVSDLLLWRC